jgi:hypothetical protein
VIWLSGWDRDDRLVGGQEREPRATMSGRFVFARLIDEAPRTHLDRPGS